MHYHEVPNYALASVLNHKPQKNSKIYQIKNSQPFKDTKLHLIDLNFHPKSKNFILEALILSLLLQFTSKNIKLHLKSLIEYQKKNPNNS